MNLVAQGLHFSWNGRPTLSDVDFAAEPGCVTALVGPNGAGKSTLLRCLLGIVRPCSGRVLLGGRDLSDFAPRERARHIAYVPQTVEIASPQTVFEVVLAGRRPHMTWSPSKRDVAVVESALERLRLHEFAKDRFQTLSGGRKQAALFARALAQEAAVFLLDEPTAALDLRRTVETAEIAAALAQAGKTVVAALHDLNLAIRLAGEATLLCGGKVHRRGTPGEVLTPGTIRAVYGVESIRFEAEGVAGIVPVGTSTTL